MKTKDDELINKNIGGYQILEKIGSGGMGSVYKALQISMERIVALKILQQNYASDPDVVRRFHNEAKSAGKLSHPNIVIIYDHREADGLQFLVMEFIDGNPLNKIIKSKPLSVREALDIAVKVCNGLNYAHNRGIIHRDIKPQNIIVGKDGDVKIIDFGIAKALEGTALTRTGAIVGTLHYIAPEILQGKIADHRADIYSIGIVLYEMLTRRLPFDAESAGTIIAKHLNEPPPPLKTFNSQLPDALENVISKALAKDREKRYQSALEFIQDIDKIKSENEGVIDVDIPLSISEKPNVLKAVERKEPEGLCEKCGSPLEWKQTWKGEFLACSQYPKCDNIKSEKTNVLCPRCGSDIVQKKSITGSIFYGCSNYIDCDFAMWNKPIKQSCPNCNSKYLLEDVNEKSEKILKCPSCEYRSDIQSIPKKIHKQEEVVSEITPKNYESITPIQEPIPTKNIRLEQANQQKELENPVQDTPKVISNAENKSLECCEKKPKWNFIKKFFKIVFIILLVLIGLHIANKSFNKLRNKVDSRKAKKNFEKAISIDNEYSKKELPFPIPPGIENADGKHPGMVFIPPPPQIGGAKRVKGFWIDIHKVTNADYEKFDPSHKSKRSKISLDDNMPVTNVTFEEANRYAKSIGKRLPTQMEWEKFVIEGEESIIIYKSQDDSISYKIGSIDDTTDNIWEWCVEPGSGPQIVCSSSNMRKRVDPDSAYNFVGFRCVMDEEHKRKQLK